ncbi:hypothetical protein ACFP1B_03680 [Streptomyces pulveraceus]|uniref:Integrase catalytic domain-containing protein n=1 Tax=Streptomyces pulveraceus TaxID=68258 RepID=A0ABW1GCP5_9ACTN
MPVRDQVSFAIEVPCGTGRAAARTAIFDVIEDWCNSHRPHSSLGYLGPAEYETALVA